MRRVAIPFVLMAAAVMPRVSSGPARAVTLPEPGPVAARAPPEIQDAAHACCSSRNHIARLLCLHRLALGQGD